MLIDAAGQYYLHGQRVFNAVEPIALAVMLAEQEGEQAQLRRALSIQGLILTATRNTPDALRSLLQALELAERMEDIKGVAAAWVNIAVTFFDATLYNDARVCYERGAVTASSIDDPALSVYLTMPGAVRSRAMRSVSSRVPARSRCVRRGTSQLVEDPRTGSRSS